MIGFGWGSGRVRGGAADASFGGDGMTTSVAGPVCLAAGAGGGTLGWTGTIWPWSALEGAPAGPGMGAGAGFGAVVGGGTFAGCGAGVCAIAYPPPIRIPIAAIAANALIPMGNPLPVYRAYHTRPPGRVEPYPQEMAGRPKDSMGAVYRLLTEGMDVLRF